jgi:hypothetical protein
VIRWNDLSLSTCLLDRSFGHLEGQLRNAPTSLLCWTDAEDPEDPEELFGPPRVSEEHRGLRALRTYIRDIDYLIKWRRQQGDHKDIFLNPKSNTYNLLYYF